MESKVHIKSAAALLAVLVIALLGSSAQAAGAQEEKPRYCVWMLWSEQPGVAEKAWDSLKNGAVFALMVRDIQARYKSEAKSYRECLRQVQMDPKVYRRVKNMRVGEFAGPIQVAEGHAVIMRTTDKWRRKGRSLYRKGKYAKAEQALLKDLELHPTSAGIWHLVALSRAARGQKKRALQALDQAIYWSPDDPNLMQDKATALVYLDRPSEAVALYKKALKLDPKNPVIISNLAWGMLKAKGDPKKALALARRAKDLEPHNGRTWFTLGQALHANQRYAEAVKAFRKADELLPGLPNLGENLMQSLRALDKTKHQPLPQPRPVPRLAPRAKARLAPAPVRIAKPAPKPEPKPAPKPAPKPKARPKPKAPPAPAPVMAKPKPEPKPEPKPAPVAKAEPKPEPAPAPKARQQEGPDRLHPFLQVGTFRDPALARRQERLLRKAGKKPYVQPWNDRKGRAWIRIILGPYPSQAAAQTEARKLKRAGRIFSYVVRMRPMSYVIKDKAPAQPKPKPEPKPGPQPIAKAPPIPVTPRPMAPPAPAPVMAKPKPEPKPIAKAPPALVMPKAAPAPRPEARPAPAPEPAPAPKPAPIAVAKPAPAPAPAPVRRPVTKVRMKIQPPPEPARPAAALTPTPKAKAAPVAKPVPAPKPKPAPKAKAAPAPVAKLEPVWTAPAPAPLPVTQPEPAQPAPAPAPKPEPAAKPAPKPEAQPAPMAKAAPSPSPMPPPTPTPPPTPPPPPVMDRGSTYILVALYDNPLKARRKALSWRRRGYGAMVSASTGEDGQVIHRLMLGPFEDKKAADKAARELSGRKIIGAYRLMVMGPSAVAKPGQ